MKKKKMITTKLWESLGRRVAFGYGRYRRGKRQNVCSPISPSCLCASSVSPNVKSHCEACLTKRSMRAVFCQHPHTLSLSLSLSLSLTHTHTHTHARTHAHTRARAQGKVTSPQIDSAENLLGNSSYNRMLINSTWQVPMKSRLVNCYLTKLFFIDSSH